jgi:hypothetical protein
MSKQIDFPEYVIKVVGAKRFAANFDKPFDEWPLTERMVERIRAYPHGRLDERIWEEPYAGGFVPRRSVTCACGDKFVGRTLKEVYALHDAHHAGADVIRFDRAGMALPAAARTTHNADALSA